MRKDGEHTPIQNPDYDSLMEAIAKTSNLGTLNQIIKSSPALTICLKKYCPVKTAAFFGRLLLNPKYHKNCLRIEYLIHASILLGEGTRAAKYQDLAFLYKTMGEECEHLEDIPEDLFAKNIYTAQGNYVVTGGIWEGADFYLQRYINLIDSMPSHGVLGALQASAHALLKVSNLVLSRAGVLPNTDSLIFDQDQLNGTVAAKASELIASVSISTADLEALGVNFEDIEPFIISKNLRPLMQGQTLGNTSLERKPLAMLGDTLYLVLPTAISLSVRWLYALLMEDEAFKPSFLRNLGKEYSNFIYCSNLIDTSDANLHFNMLEDSGYLCLPQRIDIGRYLNLVFIIDTQKDLGRTGFAGTYSISKDTNSGILAAIKSAQDKCTLAPDFKNGINLIVICGSGRPIRLMTPKESEGKWKNILISIHDLYALSNTHDYEPLIFFRLTETEEKLQKEGVILQNLSGFLNLYAWSESLDGHLVPHAELPNEARDSRLMIAIPHDELRGIRKKAAIAVDEQVQQYIDGTWLHVRKEGKSHFQEDEAFPLYIHISLNLKGAIITDQRCWWIELANPNNQIETTSYDRWKMLCVWMARAAPVLENALSSSLGHGPIAWKCIFEKPQGFEIAESFGTEDDANSSIDTKISIRNRTIEMHIGSAFDDALFNTSNIAERALVKRFIVGILKLSEQNLDIAESLTRMIVPNDKARHAHVFIASKFRDNFPEILSARPITINKVDAGLGTIKLGWKVRSPSEGGLIEGKIESQNYLNSLVSELEKELCIELKRFNREKLISKLLSSIDAASASRDRWHRTASAMLSLRTDQKSVLEAMRDYEMQLTSAIQPSRNLIEMAICESPVVGGEPIGKLDLSRLLAMASRINNLGGWSDLIRWEMMTPKVLIQPLGDVHVEHDFIDTVVESFGTATSEYRYMASARNYDENLVERKITKLELESIDQKFLEAWKEEFGVSFEDYCLYIDAIEIFAIKLQKPVLIADRSELIKLTKNETLNEKIISDLTLAPRTSWRYAPSDEQKDIDPWRFKRRLSVLRKPLLQITTDSDPKFLVAPGTIREAFATMVGNYYGASYADRHLGKPMRRYAGYARKRDGMAFNSKVSQRLRELGWETAPEIRLTKILGFALPSDYGDVDVLAWDISGGRTLIIECKDLQFKKTYGEIAEQLTDFKGIQEGTKRDLLRKHLDRVYKLREHEKQVSKYLNFDTIPTIESIIVFSNPVPMQFATGAIREEATIFTYDSLEELRNSSS